MKSIQMKKNICRPLLILFTVFTTTYFFVESTDSFARIIGRCRPTRGQDTNRSERACSLRSQHLENTAKAFEKDVQQRPELANRPFMRVLFWPNLNMGFGHVALEVFRGKKTYDAEPELHVSYAMGNSLYQDLYKHQQLPEVIELPPLSDQNYNNFIKWFNNSPYSGQNRSISYGSDYDPIHHNCANAVFNCLENSGYSLPRSPRIARPRLIRNIAWRLQ
ncbi:MAG: hypothetical protein HQK53_07585 [Oligoflexia bacterium]|nr:hypothetical protein [Oligoflexia bacterium]